MNRRDFLSRLGTAAAAGVALGESSEPVEAFGLLECPNASLLAAFAKSRAGVLACTINDQTHCADTGQRWGRVSWLKAYVNGTRTRRRAGGAIVLPESFTSGTVEIHTESGSSN